MVKGNSYYNLARGLVLGAGYLRRRTMNAFKPGKVNASRKLGRKVRLAPKVATVVDKYRPRRSHGPIQNPGNIITQSRFVSYRKPTFPAKVRKSASSPNFEIINGPGNFEALSGFQGAASGSLFTQAALLRILNAMPATAPAGNFTRRFLLERIEQKVTYTNASSASCILDIYQIVCKQDNDLVSPLTAWQDGVTMETSLPAGTPPWAVLGVKPWHSQRFKEFFGVAAHRSVNLAAGASHQHTVMLSPNQIMKEQRIRENNCYKGLTSFVLAVVKGVPVCDDADVPRLVSTAPIQIDIVTENNTKYRWISDTDTDLYITNGLTTLLQPENMNVFQGQAQPVTKAQ